MDHLEEISVVDLLQALDEVEGKPPKQRLLAAIAYKNGVTQTELASWYIVPWKPIYNWLIRLEKRPLAETVRDGPKPGRPRKLTHNKQNKLKETVHASSMDADHNVPV